MVQSSSRGGAGQAEVQLWSEYVKTAGRVAELVAMCLCVMGGGDLVPRAKTQGSEKSGQGSQFSAWPPVPGPLITEITALAAKSSSMGVV